MESQYPPISINSREWLHNVREHEYPLLDRDVEEEIVSAYRRGEKIVQIADRLILPTWHVYAYLRHRRIVAPQRYGLTGAQFRELEELLFRSPPLTLVVIGERFGVTEACVSQWVKRFGFESRFEFRMRWHREQIAEEDRRRQEEENGK
jgi:hypothetical protein